MSLKNLKTRKWNAVSLAKRLERIDGQREQRRPAEPLELFSRGQVRLQTQKSTVAALVCVDQNLSQMPIPLPGRHHLAGLHHCIFYMNMNRVRLEQRPIVQRIFILLYEIGEIENSAEFWRIDRLHQIQTLRSLGAINGLFIFVNQRQITVAEVIHLGLEAAYHFVPVLKNIPAVGRVVAEDAHERSVKKFGRFDGNFEPFEMFGPRLVDFDLADGGTYADHAQAVGLELGFDLVALAGAEIQHVFFENAAQLEMSDAILLADLNLLVKTWGDFVCEAGQFQQEDSLIEKLHGIVGFGRFNVKRTGGGLSSQIRAAFTIIELLVVIGIIAVLLAILLPAAEHVRHQAYIEKCASNLRQIGLALSIYAQDNHGNYPRTIYDPTYTSPLVSGTGVNAIDPFQPGGVQPNDLTAPLFLLMKNQHLPPTLFICPYNDATSYVADSPDLDHRSNFTNQYQNLSYSFANPYPNVAAAALGYRLTTRLSADFAVGADRNPGVDVHDNVYAPISANSPQSLMNKANSDNHEQDGQNVLYGDGHVSWHTNPFCGMQQDNIFTARNDPAQVTASPVDANDSVLLPTDD